MVEQVVDTALMFSQEGWLMAYFGFIGGSLLGYWAASAGG